MPLVRLFQKLDGGSFGYALSGNGDTCLQLGTHGSLTAARSSLIYLCYVLHRLPTWPGSLSVRKGRTRSKVAGQETTEDHAFCAVL